jgi:hypothetical protein
MKSKKINDSTLSLETEVALLKQSTSTTDSILLELKNCMIRLESKMDNGFSKINSEAWTRFYFMLAIDIGLAGLIARSAHWI